MIQPGIYPQLTAEAYHADAALGSSGARVLANDCPAAFDFGRRNQVRKREFDIGTATHFLVLEPALLAQHIVIIDAGDFRTKAAQEARDAAYKAGKTPLLPKDMDTIADMRAAIQDHPIARNAFVEGRPETSMFWQCPEFGVMCKTRPDWLPKRQNYMIDLKTSASSDPDDFAKSAANFGYHQQAAWYLDGVEQCYGARPDRFSFVVVSKAPPHLVTVYWVDPDALAWGAIQNRYARGIYAWCERNGIWPGYQPKIDGPAEAFTLRLPGWKVRELEQKHEAGAFEPPTVERIAA